MLFRSDIRVADEFKVFTNINSTVVDPKNFDARSFVDVKTDVCIIPPNSFALARTMEYFRIPRDVLTVCVGKSTYARCGLIVNVTPFEPEWEGNVTLEISNTTPLPAKGMMFAALAYFVLPVDAVPDFIAGFLYGWTGDNNLTEVEACYNSDLPIFEDLKTSVDELFHGHVIKAAEKFEKAVFNLQIAMEPCHNMSNDIHALKAWS